MGEKIRFNNLSADTHHTGAEKKQGSVRSNRSLFAKRVQGHEAAGLQKRLLPAAPLLSAAPLCSTTELEL